MDIGSGPAALEQALPDGMPFTSEELAECLGVELVVGDHLTDMCTFPGGQCDLGGLAAFVSITDLESVGDTVLVAVSRTTSKPAAIESATHRLVRSRAGMRWLSREIDWET